MASANDGWAKLARSHKAEIDTPRIEADRETGSPPFKRGEHGRALVNVVEARAVASLKIVESG